jgi:hypothetical protein
MRPPPPGPPPTPYPSPAATQAKRPAGPATIQRVTSGGFDDDDDNGRRRRPSRKERDQARLLNRTFKEIDKKGRTRRAKKQIKSLEKRLNKSDDELRMEILNEAQKNTPPKKMGELGNGPKIYSGKWRNFEEEFAREWWKAQDKPWQCYLCGGEIDPNGQGRDRPTIEHLKPWAEIKNEIPTEDVCKDGIHWRVALTEDVRDRLQDERNLAPAHQGCNSSKNGPKDTDSLAPQRLGICPGDACGLPKAR